MNIKLGDYFYLLKNIQKINYARRLYAKSFSSIVISIPIILEQEVKG